MSTAAFLSYHSADRHVASAVRRALVDAGVKCFLAHENVVISEEWRLRLLAELGSCDVFVCILSAAYVQSAWCVQECGIVAMRSEVVVVPLSLDGTQPPGFLANLQFAAIQPRAINLLAILPAFLQSSTGSSRGIDLAIAALASASSHVEANRASALLVPMVSSLTREQARGVVSSIFKNAWAQHAKTCLECLLPSVLAQCKGELGSRMVAAVRKHLKGAPPGG